jgi:prepilin-type N-terminal cleavage/methylation domain-containing protein
VSGFRQLRGQSGLTLPEVLVAAVILGIVTSLATAGLVTVMRNQVQISQRTEALAQNRVGMELITRLLRQATYPQWGDAFNSTIVSVAEPRRLVFTSRHGLNSPRRQYRFELVGSELRWGSSEFVCTGTSPAPGTGGSPCTYTTPDLTRTAVRGVRNAAGGGICGAGFPDAVFTYYEADAVNGVLTALPNPVTGDRLARVASIDIRLAVKENPAVPRPGCEQLATRVHLRNLAI